MRRPTKGQLLRRTKPQAPGIDENKKKKKRRELTQYCASSLYNRDLPGEYFDWLFDPGEQDRGLVCGQFGVDDQIRTSFNFYRP